MEIPCPGGALLSICEVSQFKTDRASLDYFNFINRKTFNQSISHLAYLDLFLSGLQVY